jgi:translation initiation factor IF-2
MPSRSSSSKSPSPDDNNGKDKAPAAKKAASKKVLSLIEEENATPKKASAPRPEGQVLKPLGARPKIEIGAKKAKADDAPAEPAKPTIAERKTSALSLFDEEPKARVRRDPNSTTGAMPPISLLRAEPAPAPVTPPPPPPAPPVVATEMPEDGEEKVLHLKPPIIVKDLAEKMGVKVFKLIGDLIAFKVFATADKAIELEIAEKICEKHGWRLERDKREKGAGVHKVEEIIVEPAPMKPDQEPADVMELRAPIITFMGHVDHGKTSLLDAVRKSSVATGEAGGITQHIGAYCVYHHGKPITFIDTPGHAAFSQMRARGANVTDIVVLIIAADDGIMPQTREALSHAKAAKVQLMVAINKCDLPTANVMRVKGQLQDIGLAPVDWGGEIECMEVSATKGIGIENLLDTMSLQAEVLELKANPNAPARATIIESSMQEGKGPVATVIVNQGSLKVGQPFICGPHWGKVKAILNDRGESLKAVLPGMPGELVGFSDMPHVGDEVVVMDSERAVKKLSEERQEDLRRKKLQVPRRSTLESLFANIKEGEKKALKIVLKGDVQGSIEAIVKCLTDIKSEKIRLEILHSDPGAISESDILLASASDAIVIGFNTKVENKALAVAKREGVQIKLFSIIYELIDQVKESLLGMLDPLTREKVIGHAKVKMVFNLTRGTVAGCGVTDGRIDRKARARVLRNGQAVYDGNVDTLKRFQDDVAEVRNGLECGIKLGHYNEYEEGDIIECYELEKVAQTL